MEPVERKRRPVVSLAGQYLGRLQSRYLLVIHQTTRASDEFYTPHQEQDQKGQTRRIQASMSKVYEHWPYLRWLRVTFSRVTKST